MRIAHIALLSAMVFGAVVSCAEGTGDVTGLANGGASTLAAAGGSSTGGSSTGGSSTDGSPTEGSSTSGPSPSGSTTDGGSPVGILGSPPPGVSSEVTGDYSLDVACRDTPIVHVCLISAETNKNVLFTLPPGTQRSSIVYTVTTEGPSAGGSAEFASSNVLDGTVRLHGYADAFSSVHVEVTGVIVVPE
jgi:hypothetical protein